MPAQPNYPKRLWTNYFTTAANATEQKFTFSTDDEYRTRYIESIFVGISTAGVQISLYTQGQEYSTVDCTRFAAGDAVLHVEFDVLARNTLTIGLKNIAGSALTNVPVVIGYRVNPADGPQQLRLYVNSGKHQCSIRTNSFTLTGIPQLVLDENYSRISAFISPGTAADVVIGTSPCDLIHDGYNLCASHPQEIQGLEAVYAAATGGGPTVISVMEESYQVPDYPGVDPDGLTPGGLQVAGKVNASSLAVLGRLLSPSVFGWGMWSGFDGVNVPHGTSVPLTFDTEDKALAEVTFSAPDNKVTFNTDGTYLALGDAFQNTGGASSGFISANFVLSAGAHWGFQNALHYNVIDIGDILLLELCDVAAGATLAISLTDAEDVDSTIGGKLAIMRLA